MPRNAAAAQRAKEKKEKKELELRIKTANEKCDEGRAFLEPEGKAAPQYTKAIACFDSAIGTYGEIAEPFAFRASAYLEQKQPEQAIEDYTKALSLNPQSVMSLEGRAACYELLQQWDKAIADYSTITTIQPENDHAYNMRGCCRLRKRPNGLKLKNADFAAVVDDFQTALRLNENNFHAHANLGKAFEDHQMYKKAIDEFSRALKLKDDYTYALFRRGCSAMSLVEERRRHREQESKQLAVEDEIAAEEAREKARQEERDLLKQAIADFTRVIGEEKEKELTAVIYRGSCFQMAHEYSKAEEDFLFAKKAVTNPELAPAVRALTEVLEIKLAALHSEMGK